MAMRQMNDRVDGTDLPFEEARAPAAYAEPAAPGTPVPPIDPATARTPSSRSSTPSTEWSTHQSTSG